MAHGRGCLGCHLAPKSESSELGETFSWCLAHWLLGGDWNHGNFSFPIFWLGSSQLTIRPSFFRGVGKNHQPDWQSSSQTISNDATLRKSHWSSPQKPVAASHQATHHGHVRPPKQPEVIWRLADEPGAYYIKIDDDVTCHDLSWLVSMAPHKMRHIWVWRCEHSLNSCKLWRTKTGTPDFGFLNYHPGGTLFNTLW